MKLKSKLFFYVLFIVALTIITSTSCKKKTETPPIQETGTVTDVDNNTYKTVKIGNQWWMAENLRVKRYRNGFQIPEMTETSPDSVWAQKTTGSFCVYGYNQSLDPTFGLLYNWYTIIDTSNIAPVGWHVPSDDEWKTLEMYLGMSQADVDQVKWRGTDQGDKLKVASPQLNYWASYGNVWSTNATGFSAVAGSCRLFNATWGDPGLSNTGFWWSSSIHTGDNEVWYRYLDYKNSNVFRYHGPKTYGMSIRCVKD